MAPKGKGGDKGKGKDTKDDKGGGKAKSGAQTINVRHILCEKHAKKEEALAKINAGAKFDDVAREFSEDKARTGKIHDVHYLRFVSEDLQSARRGVGMENEGSTLAGILSCSF